MDIYQMKGAKEFIGRILQAVQNKEKIIVLGDADPDGVASVVILKECLEILGNPAFCVYFPNWEKESYGLNEKALKFFAKQILPNFKKNLGGQAPVLLITLDCGISNIKEAEQAKNMGFELIIIDHHQPLEKLPQASIIINPKQENDSYPFKDLCAAGIVYNLVKRLLFEAQKPWEPERFLELAMIATLYDGVPLEQDNQKIVEQGLLSLPHTKRTGLQALIKVTECKDFSHGEVQKKIVPVLGSADTKKHKNDAFSLLTEKSFKKAEKFAKVLLKNNKAKKEKVRMVLKEIESRIEQDMLLVFEGDKDWPLTVMGSAAIRICHKYDKPIFLYNMGRKQSRGTVRAPKEIDSVELMSNCAGFLESYGGHSQASGFRIKNENLEQFRQCLVEQLAN